MCPTNVSGQQHSLTERVKKDKKHQSLKLLIASFIFQIPKKQMYVGRYTYECDVLLTVDGAFLKVQLIYTNTVQYFPSLYLKDTKQYYFEFIFYMEIFFTRNSKKL